jgi:hypothetical protein
MNHAQGIIARTVLIEINFHAMLRGPQKIRAEARFRKISALGFIPAS